MLVEIAGLRTPGLRKVRTLPVSVSQRSLDFDPHSYRREAVTVSIADAFGKIDTGFMTG